MSIEPAGTIVSTWGEGPIWHKDSLYYVDIEGHFVHRFTPATGAEHSWNVGERVGTVVPRKAGGLVIAGDSGIRFFDPESGQFTPVGDPEPDKPDNRFNDGKCSPDGRFFAGTISMVKKTGDARLYRLDPDLTITEVYGPVTNSNGIVWTRDGATCYYIDTPRKEVIAFDYAQGTLSNPRQVIDTRALDGSPDGMAIDAHDKLWIAQCHAGLVVCHDPDTRTILHRIELPCAEVTACAFGGPDLRDLYVTTGLPKGEPEPLAGRLLVVRGLGTTGVSSSAFVG